MQSLIFFVAIMLVLIAMPVSLFSKLSQILIKFHQFKNRKIFLIAISLVALVLCIIVNEIQNLFFNNISLFSTSISSIDSFISLLSSAFEHIYIAWIWGIIFSTSILNIVIFTFLRKKGLENRYKYLSVIGIFFIVMVLFLLITDVYQLISFLPIWLSYQSLRYLFMSIAIFVNEKLLPNTANVTSSGLPDGTVLNYSVILPAITFLFYYSSRFVAKRWQILRKFIIIIGSITGIGLFFVALNYDYLLINLFTNKGFSSAEGMFFFVVYFFVFSQIVSLIHEWGHTIPVRYHKLYTTFVFNFDVIGGIKARCVIPHGALTPDNRIEVALMGHLWTIIFLTPIWIIFAILQIINYIGIINQLIYFFIVIIFFETLSFIITTFTSPTSDGGKILSELKLKKQIEKIDEHFKPKINPVIQIIEDSGKFYLTSPAATIELNPFGKMLIENYFDGTKTITEITTELSQKFSNVSAEEIKKDIIDFTKDLGKRRVIYNFRDLEGELMRKTPFVIHEHVG